MEMEKPAPVKGTCFPIALSVCFHISLAVKLMYFKNRYDMTAQNIANFDRYNLSFRAGIAQSV
jgi:hypothetical protein